MKETSVVSKTRAEVFPKRIAVCYNIIRTVTSTVKRLKSHRFKRTVGFGMTERLRSELRAQDNRKNLLLLVRLIFKSTVSFCLAQLL